MGQPVTVIIERAGPARRIQDLRGRFASPEPVLRGPVLDYIDEALALNFLTEGHWSGHPWAELKDSTIRKKIKAGKNIGILRYNDILSSAVALPYGINPLKRIVVTDRSLTIRILDRKARLHQDGTPRMVARQVIPSPMPRTFVDGLKNIVRRFLIQAELK